jgi:hypothetical protein
MEDRGGSHENRSDWRQWIHRVKARCQVARARPRSSRSLGLLIAFSGEWDSGLALVQRAMALNPHLPDWVYLPYFYNHYRKGEYQTALQGFKKINMPEAPWPQMGIGAACGQRNQPEMAGPAIELVRRHQPLYLDLKYYREDAEKMVRGRVHCETALTGPA